MQARSVGLQDSHCFQHSSPGQAQENKEWKAMMWVELWAEKSTLKNKANLYIYTYAYPSAFSGDIIWSSAGFGSAKISGPAVLALWAGTQHLGTHLAPGAEGMRGKLEVMLPKEHEECRS